MEIELIDTLNIRWTAFQEAFADHLVRNVLKWTIFPSILYHLCFLSLFTSKYVVSRFFINWYHCPVLLKSHLHISRRRLIFCSNTSLTSNVLPYVKPKCFTALFWKRKKWSYFSSNLMFFRKKGPNVDQRTKATRAVLAGLTRGVSP